MYAVLGLNFDYEEVFVDRAKFPTCGCCDGECDKWFSFEDVEFMLYTWQTDKNDKEIYQGDIVNFITSDGRKLLSEVLFVKGAFQVSCDYGVLELLYEQDITNVEIVGSIYENPELLDIAGVEI